MQPEANVCIASSVGLGILLYTWKQQANQISVIRYPIFFRIELSFITENVFVCHTPFTLN